MLRQKIGALVCATDLALRGLCGGRQQTGKHERPRCHRSVNHPAWASPRGGLQVRPWPERILPIYLL